VSFCSSQTQEKGHGEASNECGITWRCSSSRLRRRRPPGTATEGGKSAVVRRNGKGEETGASPRLYRMERGGGRVRDGGCIH
jgi:hypothetical protein